MVLQQAIYSSLSWDNMISRFLAAFPDAPIALIISPSIGKTLKNSGISEPSAILSWLIDIWIKSRTSFFPSLVQRSRLLNPLITRARVPLPLIKSFEAAVIPSILTNTSSTPLSTSFLLSSISSRRIPLVTIATDISNNLAS